MKRFSGLIAVAVLMLFAVGCDDPYRASLKAGADIAAGIGQGMQTVDSVRVSGLITPAEESRVLDYLKFANDADKAFLTCAETAHTSGSKSGAFTSCAQTFNTALNNPTQAALIRVANPQAQGTITNIVNGITTAVTAIVAGLGGK